MRFHDRIDAGRKLAERLSRFAHRSDVIVLGLPRGGVPVAHEVALRLGVPFEAIAEGGIEVLSRDLIRDIAIPPALVERVAGSDPGAATKEAPIEPLERSALWEAGEMSETFPSGL